ncbi:MAG: hypothetical protein KA200_01375 [Burkholderiales bacterium]|jgi:hypothetical protein|nr:hypothetical protein [Burkholderiales bacterium]
MQKTFNHSRYSFVDQLFKVPGANGRPVRVRSAGGWRFPSGAGDVPAFSLTGGDELVTAQNL